MCSAGSAALRWPVQPLWCLVQPLLPPPLRLPHLFPVYFPPPWAVGPRPFRLLWYVLVGFQKNWIGLSLLRAPHPIVSWARSVCVDPWKKTIMRCTTGNLQFVSSKHGFQRRGRGTEQRQATPVTLIKNTWWTQHFPSLTVQNIVEFFFLCFLWKGESPESWNPQKSERFFGVLRSFSN